MMQVPGQENELPAVRVGSQVIIQDAGTEELMTFTIVPPSHESG